MCVFTRHRKIYLFELQSAFLWIQQRAKKEARGKRIGLGKLTHTKYILMYQTIGFYKIKTIHKIYVNDANCIVKITNRTLQAMKRLKKYFNFKQK